MCTDDVAVSSKLSRLPYFINAMTENLKKNYTCIAHIV